MTAISNYQIGDFEGFTPEEMHGLLYSPFDPDRSPLILNTGIACESICQVKFYHHILQYLHALRGQEPLKLTQKGNLPRKFCRELFDLKIYEDDIIAKHFQKNPLMKEDDFPYINLINIITHLSKFTKKQHGKISLAKKCHKFMTSGTAPALYCELFKTYITKFNWGYFDHYPESWIIQGGFGFSMLLVQKYGDRARPIEFYCDKYLKAFPGLMRDFPDKSYSSGMKQFQNCYELRVFERFLQRFGFIDIEKKDAFHSMTQTIIKKNLIDQVVKWKTSTIPISNNIQ